MADHSKTYSTGAVEWIYPHEDAPPPGKKIFILTTGGVAIVGTWAGWTAGHVAWQHLFRRNAEKEIAATAAAMSWA